MDVKKNVEHLRDKLDSYTGTAKGYAETAENYARKVRLGSATGTLAGAYFAASSGRDIVYLVTHEKARNLRNFLKTAVKTGLSVLLLYEGVRNLREDFRSTAEERN
ncbi:MAG: hypothetical protein COY38_03830 [Candidatus Aenigmarchaeota archaeon CG_4_10_14_0_8_um_filter_37_24]|nr:hypothetical protein [Candidatus Aenigmarchaeota archaeon]OIN88241.1 MAG: hypothetical protein AUJ50_01380 [Candidatus Aenigmarchaeota archaeon CG1_02_38_14]PIV69167.1 MAG: hypothetical protein COS07_01660 [Candidatus Aenigmarchaeota archaeon CG01_land_8_20_14_3_00_37_9]PIW41190.1 MAG: hypothetical protein COW21_03365 [Candidatus Aenigmarchaeota archaeon CG15_BIG_FIL_POST_REV_8_21_14_020_37_27]PIX50820.1 MAG: hypothetical protein COZ52_02290 [Candidatus Aenigmarchaeota archaeon CG_4_8_14_3_u